MRNLRFLKGINQFCPDLSLSSNQSASVYRRSHPSYFGNSCHAGLWLWHLQG